jgi:hypothetical protein
MILKTAINKLYSATLIIAFTSSMHAAIGGTVTCPDLPVDSFITDQKIGTDVTDQHEDLKAEALGDPDKGGLCNAKVFRLDKPYTVFRAYGGSAGLIGRWWGWTPPYYDNGTKTNYPERYNMCPEWGNTMSDVASCHVNAGTLIVVGPGQGVKCDSIEYKQSTVNQVYIPDVGEYINPTTDCSTPGTPNSWK